MTSLTFIRKHSASPSAGQLCGKTKASMLRTALFSLSFATVTVGVALEASTPSGWDNAYGAFFLVVPAAGFLLSLSNYSFLHLYSSAKRFRRGTALINLALTVASALFTLWHYGAPQRPAQFLRELWELASLIPREFWEFGLFQIGLLAYAVIFACSCLFSCFCAGLYANYMRQDKNQTT